MSIGSKHRSVRLHRLARRLLRHHLPLALLSIALTAAIFYTIPTKDRDSTFRLSLASAEVSLALLAATFLIGPLNVLRAQPNPVSTDLRRDVGIWAAIVGLVHVLIGLQVHLRGNPWQYFFYPTKGDRLQIRFDAFGWANHTGLIATVILVLLLALSNDLSLRLLKTGPWKTLQRFNYGLLVLVVLHSVVYQRLEKRESQLVVVFGAIVAVILILQLAGFVWRRRALSRSKA